MGMVHLKDLVEFASDAAFAVNAQGEILAWNKKAQELLGYDPDEAIGRRCGDILNGLYATGAPMCAMCDCLKCFQAGMSFSARDCRLQHKDGHLVSASASTLVDPSVEQGGDTKDATAIVLIRPFRGDLSRSNTLPLRIFTLGHFGLTIAGNAMATNNWKRRHALSVLKILVSHVGRPVDRHQLMEQLWTGVETSRGWTRLKVTMSFLRNELVAGGLSRDFIQTVDQSYLLPRDGVWIDADVFEKQALSAMQLARQKRYELALQCCEDARQLYRGEYMPDDLYNDWYAQRREILREMYINMLQCMMICLEAVGDVDGAGQIRHEAHWHNSDEHGELAPLVL